MMWLAELREASPLHFLWASYSFACITHLRDVTVHAFKLTPVSDVYRHYVPSLTSPYSTLLPVRAVAWPSFAPFAEVLGEW
jgi:hypothetical protein